MSNSDPPPLDVRDLPASLDAELIGGAKAAPPVSFEAVGDGRTVFDTPQSRDGDVTVVFPQQKFKFWKSQALVRIESPDKRQYLAQVTEGPYADPTGLPAGSQTIVAAQIEGSTFTPPYHGRAVLTVVGEMQAGGGRSAPMHRPLPNSPVWVLDDEQTRKSLDCDGDVRLGKAVGFDDLPVGLRSAEKHHFPRHTLVVGTTGSGKSTLVAALAGKLANAGFTVLIFDVEGEYGSIHRPADSAKIRPALESWNVAPEGIKDSFLLVPTDMEPTAADHPPMRRFCLKFEDISPAVALELLRGNDAQGERFQMAYDAAGELVGRLMSDSDRRRHLEAVRDWDEQESGHPDLKLAHVLDMAIAVSALVGGDEVEEQYLHADGFKSHLKELASRAAAVVRKTSSAPSWRKTVGLISALYKTKLFDKTGKANDGESIVPLRYDDMLHGGRVVVFDLQPLESPAHRNLAISGVLRGVMAAQDKLYADAPPDQKPKTVVIIEEAHEFVSAERIKQMPTVYAQLQRIARRGRKRWLGLLFATQFPQHLPSELFSLCNNRVLLRLGDEPTILRLKNSIGGVPENLWTRLRTLAPGQAIVSAHGIDPALAVALEPGRCKLLMVD